MDELANLFLSVAKQFFVGPINLNGRTIPVAKTTRQGLKIACFEANGHRIMAIEQNPRKPSEWGQLARRGHKVVQFLHENGGYLGNAVEEKATIYKPRR
jgi:hypothetical protein